MNGFGGSNMDIVNQIMASRARERTGVPSPPTQGAPQDPDGFWSGVWELFSGRDTDGLRTERSTAKQDQFLGSLDSLSNRFQNVGGGPIGRLPTPYSGPPVTMGRNQGAGLQALIAQLLQGSRR